MKLLYLHGPPATGKFTIAKELEAKIGARLFHNHLTIDVAKAIFEFGSQAFWELVDALRLQCIMAAAQQPNGLLTYTSCYDHPRDLGFFERIEHAVLSNGSVLLPVYLQCDVSELEKRVSNNSRVQMGKIRSTEGLHKVLNQWNCLAVPRDDCLTVSTAGKAPAECADEIIAFHELGR
ncbi:MAG: hypothetical protein NT075_27090 [Chloroflexi bacterium]|nr:hypothetical protein [Chloroflexota bacterium]